MRRVGEIVEENVIGPRLRATEERVVVLKEMLERAKDDRDLAFALAHEYGWSSGDVARLLGVHVNHISGAFARGRLELARRRAA